LERKNAEKFFDIKCRIGNLKPDAAVIVATIKALKFQGGMGAKTLDLLNMEALENGLQNLGQHISNMQKFNIPVMVAINRFSNDRVEEVDAVVAYCKNLGINAHECTHWADGGKGAISLAKDVIEKVDSGVADFKPLYKDDMGLWEKARHIAMNIYGADDIVGDTKIRNRFKEFQDQGYGHLPICMAKTQYSFSTDPSLKGAPKNHVVPIREVRLAAGAGFIVAVCGDIMTMPGLPRHPAAEKIGIDENGETVGLF